MQVLLPLLETLPAPERGLHGCACPGATGGMEGVNVPTLPVDARPRFGYEKAFWFFYNTACGLHGRRALDTMESIDIIDAADIS